MVIIHSDVELPMGPFKQIPGYNYTITDSNREPHTIPFVVVRKATKQEYIEFATANGGYNEREYTANFFYEIQVD